MEQKRDLVRTYNSQGLKLDQALEVVGMAKSTYYFRRKHTRSGRRKTTQTLFKGFVVDDSFVVACIKEIISKDYIDYGYKKCTVNLCRLGFEIGVKKVYRLMDESNLLNPPKKSKSGQFDKEIVKNKPNPNGPLEIIELDIKYMYIEGEGRHAYLITLLDVFHREVYGWHLGYSMRATIVVNLILDFIDKELINAEDRAKKIELSFRSDNGSQFISKNYKKLMQKFNLKAVYIPPATPQLNGHIESYHSIVQKEVCDKNEFKI